ncbi:MAG: rhodanese-related sulfurtransferase [Paracoccus sp. (in: a-proteobacteria)]|uniref:oxygen-dependent tRNA uridine(34) hydroxylase TrhO n=1 Tax=Paracoccus sp. TaxID=267 RepID=UPI0026E0A18C|nr:rhodanese-related sulfurtransferase [Paracoccus sp. (in: a-proteobacteria)]MDO5630569.1 rhodanese-related sulfurtransferase [Paracoccus sp. (in: a-proteobacteria)]
MLTVAALYHFTRFDDPAALHGPLLSECTSHGVRGTLLLAREGINGTIAGPAAGIAAVLDHIRALPGCDGLVWKESRADTMPFARMKVRLKREIVTMGQPDVDPTAAVGRYVAPGDWNTLISANDVVVIDTRNDYEYAIGSFARAIDPGTRSFRDFPAWWRANADQFAGKRVAMFCTGGIRCEKSTNFLLGEGVPEVFHLQGGILKYLEDVPESESLWHGDCFVFDQRVSLTHGLAQGAHDGLCHACRRPLSPGDRARPEYETGVQCHHCAGEYSDADRTRFRERQRQVELAEARGTTHLGG